MSDMNRIKERFEAAPLLIAKFGADGEKTVCYQSLEDIPSLITTIESLQTDLQECERATVMWKRHSEEQELLVLKRESVIQSQKEEIETLQKEKESILKYHRNRIEHWKQFRKEFKDGSYSLTEACEIRIDTHQVAINHINSLSNIQEGATE